MADIFLSYSSDDKAQVAPLVGLLEQSGFTVWWDNDLRGGSRFSEEIEIELEKANTVVVVWSATSRRSRWVTDEADSALNARKLIPIKLDSDDAPIGFRQIQTIDFSSWTGSQDEGPFETLCQAVRYHLSKGESKAQSSAPHGATAPEASIAVLPFVNMSSDPEQEYFSDGISEELLNLLAKIGNLKVPARTSSFQFKGKNQNISKVGEALGVAHVLEGSVRKAGNRVRITAQLIKVSDGYHLWSETYDRILEDVFAIQDEIAAAIVDALKAKLLVNPIAPASVRSKSVIAYEEYLIGQQSLQSRTILSIETARKHFETSLEADPDFLPSLIGISDSILLLSNHHICYGTMPLPKALSESKPYLDHAHSLDQYSDEVHVALAFYFYLADDLDQAQTHAEKAISLNANSSLGFRILGLILKMRSNPRALVVRTREKALSLNPISNVDLINLIEELPLRGRFNEAQKLIERLNYIEPDSIFSAMGEILIAQNNGNLRKVLEVYQNRKRAIDSRQLVFGLTTTLIQLGEKDPIETICPSFAFAVYCQLGMTDDANRIHKQSDIPSLEVPPITLAYWHMLNERADEALEILEPLEPTDPTDWGSLFNTDNFCTGALTLWQIRARQGDTAKADYYKRKLNELYSVFITDHEGIHRVAHYVGACVCAMEGDVETALREAEAFARQCPAYSLALLNAPPLQSLVQDDRFKALRSKSMAKMAEEREKAEVLNLLPLREEFLDRLKKVFA